MKLSILHISDLHRMPNNPIRNVPLIDSLERDCLRYTRDETPTIRKPDLIIISGDIIFGIDKNSQNPDEELEAQYSEALDFLNILVEKFFNGDKSKIILVPGNHDVSSYHFYKSLEKIEIPQDEKKKLVTNLFSQNSNLRWSWNELELYKIINKDMYNYRLNTFCEFYKKFYENKRAYLIDPKTQYDIFDYPDFDLSIVGFNSCYNNDPLNKQGAINPICIGNVSSHLRSLSFNGRLRMGVWHHNTEGMPMACDYMNPDILQNLIDCGFSIGLHGHQHKPQFIDCRFKHGAEKLITVISTGTLCGGPVHRFGRAYYLIELDTAEFTGKLHIREMQNDNLELPIWAGRPIPPENISYLNFKFDPPPKPMTQVSVDIKRLNVAQELFDKKDFKGAATIFKRHSDKEGVAKRLLLDCYYNTSNWRAIITEYDKPKSNTEIVYLIEAYWAEKEIDQLNNLLGKPEVAESTDPSVIEIKNKYIARLKNVR